MNSTSAQAYAERANAYLKLGVTDKAQFDIERAVNFSPRNGIFLSRQASVYNAIGDFQKAVDYSTSSIEISSKYWEPYLNRGYAYDQLGNKEKAFEDYSMSIKLNPYEVAPFYYRGIIYGERDLWKEAKSDLEAAFKLDSNSWPIRSRLRAVYQRLGIDPNKLDREGVK